MKSFDISKFNLEAATLELRYDSAFPLWDRAGALWAEIRNKYHDISIHQAEPNTTVFRYMDKFEMGIHVDRLSLSTNSAKNWPSEFLDIAQTLVSTASNVLNINEFSRIGIRPIFVCETTEQEAIELFVNTKMLKMPNKSEYFGIKGQPKLPEFKLSWESETLGVTVHIQFIENKINIGVPFNLLRYLDTRKIERLILQFDADYYTKVGVRVSQLDVRDWVKQALHVINRDIVDFITG